MEVESRGPILMFGEERDTTKMEGCRSRGSHEREGSPLPEESKGAVPTRQELMGNGGLRTDYIHKFNVLDRARERGTVDNAESFDYSKTTSARSTRQSVHVAFQPHRRTLAP